MAKLSKEAAKRKAVRDKKAAMTPARRKKKAENQRKRRAAANKHGKSWLNGKDYDHDDKRFESIKANRGNDGNGTKKESNKNTKKTNQMAKKKKSPLNAGTYSLKNSSVKPADVLGQGPKAKMFRAVTGIDTPKSSFPSKITSKTGGSSNLDFSKGNVLDQYSKRKSGSSDGIMIRDANKNNAARIKNKTSVKPKSSTSTKAKPVAKPSIKPTTNSNVDKSGGYLKDTKNFSLGVDTKLSAGSMPKFEKTVTNARSADYDLVRAKGRGRTSRLKTRLAKRQGRVENRVDRSLARIDARQQRQGTKYNAKMAKQDKGVNVGKMESQRKLDAFEKSMDSPRATPRTSGAGNIKANTTIPKLRTPKSNQTVAKPSMRLNTSAQTSKVIDDSRIKKGAKKASGGAKVSADTYKSLTGFNKMTSKPSSSGGMQRGMTRVDQTKKLTNLASGNQPRKDVKNMSSKNYLTKGIKPSYKNN